MIKCRDCEHWTAEVGNEKWGKCSEALNGTMFMNHTKRGSYMAKHTNSRWHGQKACKVRFEERRKK